MLCLDIDGTLLNSNFEITAGNRSAIRAASEKAGVMVVLVSARMPQGMYFLVDEIGISSPLISYNGALIFDEHRRVISEDVIPVPCIERIYRELRNSGLSFNYYRGDHWFVEKESEWTKQESIITGVIPEIVPHAELMRMWTATQSGPNKILLMGEGSAVQEADHVIENLGMGEILSFPSKTTYYEIIPSSVSKTKAIQILQEKYGIHTEQILAIGDNFNDIDMLIHSGLGIAMGNAPDKVRQMANEVTETNDNDGVALAIRKHILHEMPYRREAD